MNNLIERAERAGVDEQRHILELAWQELYDEFPSTVAWANDPASRFTRMLQAEAYLSAAEMLVPEGCHFLLAAGPDRSVCDIHTKPLGIDGDWLGHSVATTPALALAAAALRARKEQA